VTGLHDEYGDEFINHKSREFLNQLDNCHHFAKYAVMELVLILSYKVNSFATYTYVTEIRAVVLEF
jgi:hypothetical protein